MKNESNEIVMYESSDGAVKLPIRVDYGEETVWLNRSQIAELFDRDVKTIGKHINNSLKEELSGLSTVAKFATVQLEGDREVVRNIEYYNLEVIDDHTLVALTILIAESRPEEKDMMITVVMNCICG